MPSRRARSRESGLAKTVRRFSSPPLMAAERQNHPSHHLTLLPQSPVTPPLTNLLPIMTHKIDNINKDLFVRMKDDPNFLASDLCGELLLEGMEKSEVLVSFVFTSWGNLGFNDLDFGWGKPVWVGFRGGGAQNTVPNTVVFVKTQQGIDAWVSMDEERLAVLENDGEFLRKGIIESDSLKAINMIRGDVEWQHPMKEVITKIVNLRDRSWDTRLNYTPMQNNDLAGKAISDPATTSFLKAVKLSCCLTCRWRSPYQPSPMISAAYQRKKASHSLPIIFSWTISTK
ncbi:vinorine synthase-like [Senna tora]|uniref:Vinorine synthase-like n=1 Tax=Senna tora TaxID=362788 RepID=A0A834SRY7_9FABA|nr:vinorine synthase-like [Senna tora]